MRLRHDVFAKGNQNARRISCVTAEDVLARRAEQDRSMPGSYVLLYVQCFPSGPRGGLSGGKKEP